MLLEFLRENERLINENTKILNKTCNTHALCKQPTLQSPGVRIEMSNHALFYIFDLKLSVHG